MRVHSPTQPVQKTLSYAFAGAVQRDCKPNSVFAFYSGENHLSQQPYPELWFVSEPWSEPLRSSLFGLAPSVVFRAFVITHKAVVSYTTFSPLPNPCGPGGIFSVALSVSTL